MKISKKKIAEWDNSIEVDKTTHDLIEDLRCEIENSISNLGDNINYTIEEKIMYFLRDYDHGASRYFEKIYRNTRIIIALLIITIIVVVVSI